MLMPPIQPVASSATPLLLISSFHLYSGAIRVSVQYSSPGWSELLTQLMEGITLAIRLRGNRFTVTRGVLGLSGYQPGNGKKPLPG